MHKACFVFCFFFLLEVFFTLPSCKNNNQRTFALNYSCTKTTFDQIIIFRGFYLVGHSIILEGDQMLLFHAVPRGS